MSKPIRRQYTREFKLEAVRLANESSLPMRQVARQLGIHRNMLARWRREQRAQGAAAFDRETISEVEEVEQLRQEVRLLREEREILKKALAIISQEKGGVSR